MSYLVLTAVTLEYLLSGCWIHQTITMWINHLLAQFLVARNVTRILMESSIIPRMVIRKTESKSFHFVFSFSKEVCLFVVHLKTTDFSKDKVGDKLSSSWYLYFTDWAHPAHFMHYGLNIILQVYSVISPLLLMINIWTTQIFKVCNQDFLTIILILPFW